MSRIVCLDLGQKLGWAIMDGEEITSGMEKLAGNTIGSRLTHLTRFVKEKIAVEGTSVVYEYVTSHGPGGFKAAHWYGAYQGILEMTCLINKRDLYSIHVSTLKKRFTGDGKAKKDQIIKLVNEIYSHKIVKDDNEADALAMLYLTANQDLDKLDFLTKVMYNKHV